MEDIRKLAQKIGSARPTITQFPAVATRVMTSCPMETKRSVSKGSVPFSGMLRS